MKDEIKINQEQTKGNEGTQIGVQTNIDNLDKSIDVTTVYDNDFTVNNNSVTYIGMSPQEATELAFKLFFENFPKLQEEAVKIVEERVKKFLENLIVNIDKNKLDAFKDPGVQYSLFDAQKQYVKYGNESMLDILVRIVSERINHFDENLAFNVVLDKAIEIAELLSQEHLDYLSGLFLTTKVVFNNINNIDQLKSHLDYIDSVFPNFNLRGFSYLSVLGCLQLSLHDVVKVYANRYNLNKDDVDKICSSNIKKLTGDFSTSQVGSLLAIINLEKKTEFKFNLRMWINN